MREYHRSKHATRKNPDGSNAYITEQSGKDQCDINLIIAKYPQRIIASKLAKDEAVFADVSGIHYQTSLNLVKETEANFMKLPPEVRSKFGNDPSKYLDFLARPQKAADQAQADRPPVDLFTLCHPVGDRTDVGADPLAHLLRVAVPL